MQCAGRPFLPAGMLGSWQAVRPTGAGPRPTTSTPPVSAFLRRLTVLGPAAHGDVVGRTGFLLACRPPETCLVASERYTGNCAVRRGRGRACSICLSTCLQAGSRSTGMRYWSTIYAAPRQTQTQMQMPMQTLIARKTAPDVPLSTRRYQEETQWANRQTGNTG